MKHQHRRQHAAAAHRRQTDFDPDAYLSRLNEGDPFTNIFPTQPTLDIFPTPRTRGRETDSSTPIILPTPTMPSTPDSSSTSTSFTSSGTPTASSTSTTSTSTTVPTPTSSSKIQVQTTAAPAHTTSSKPVNIVTSASSISAAAASVSSSDASVSSASSVSTGAVVGGLIAGLIAIAAIAVGIIYFLRRKRQEQSLAGTAPFDQGDFRRSAALLADPPTHADTVARGFNPPPQMMQRGTASPAPTFGTQYGRPGYLQEDSYRSPQFAQYPQYADSPMSANYGANQSYPLISPGQIVSPHPIYTPQSPIEQYSATPATPYPVLTRQTSASSAASGGPFATPAPSVHGQVNNVTNPDMRRDTLPAGDYVDLSRSSVSPFQAAQYVEISRRLNSEVPSGLATAALERELPPLPPQSPNANASPFADPTSAPPTPGAQYAVDRRGTEDYVPAPVLAAAGPDRRASTYSLGTSEAEQTLDFPAPPMPAAPPLATATRYRINSMPPTLPELNVSRASVGSLSPTFGPIHIGNRDSAMLNSGGNQNRFPTTPSPLASSFGMPASPAPAATSSTVVPHVSSSLSQPAPMSAASDASFIQAPPTPRPAPAVPSDPKNRQTTFSMYDPEDAYGGI